MEGGAGEITRFSYVYNSIGWPKFFSHKELRQRKEKKTICTSPPEYYELIQEFKFINFHLFQE